MYNRESILLVGNFLSQDSGVRFVCEDLAERLTAAGWSVMITSAKLNRPSRMLDMLSTIYRQRRKYHLALVDVYSGPSFIWAEAACMALKMLGKPIVLTLHGGNLPNFARRWPGRVGRLLGSATLVTTPSSYLQKAMEAYRQDIAVIANPLKINGYHYQDRNRPKPQLIWLRAFRVLYNPQLAPKVLARLAFEFPDIHLTMVGPDTADGTLPHTQSLAEELQMSGRITFAGQVPKAAVPDWMAKGDIFLNTTNVDNTPVSVLEAMASGLCVVSTDVGGLPYLLDHDHDALLVPANDPTAMAAAVRRILTEPGLAERLSRNARQKAEQFDWSTILPQWEALLTSVTARKSS
jgi:glycosyltransferase involved in cell wall biosynthesis